MEWYCEKCQRKYAEKTQDGVCKDINCYPQQLVEYTGQPVKEYANIGESAATVEQYARVYGEVPEHEPAPAAGIMQGLCVLVCDASGING